MLALSIAFGSALGGVARFWVTSWFAARYGQAFPLGTVLVNVTGCFLIGLFSCLTGPGSRVSVHPVFRQFFMVGVCGGYTTFSSFSLQALDLARSGRWLLAGINVFGSVLACLLAVTLGYALAFVFSAKR